MRKPHSDALVVPKVDFAFSSDDEDGENETNSTIMDDEITYNRSDLIGEGNFGAVYKGYCRGAQVAVKIPKFSDLTEDKVEAFREELKVMARIVHPRVVALLGAYIPRDFNRNELKIVMELFGRDDIEKLLLDPKSSQFSLYERVKWMKQVAEGLAWIHGAGIVHRDLKPSNVLYDAKSRTVKVCDFGLSVLLPRGDATLLDPKGTPLYVAPELVTEGPTTHSCDVFSYGIMGYVFIARKRPYDNQTDLPDDIAEFLGYVVDGVRPWMKETEFDFPPELPRSLIRLLTRCWDADFMYRPSFEEILRDFDSILVDCASSHSVSGASFWKRKFVDPTDMLNEEVSWELFKNEFWKSYANSEDLSDPVNKDICCKCLKELFCETKQKEEIVSIESFGRTLGFLPYLKKGFFTSLIELCRQPWFWGAVDPKSAYKALVPAKSRSFMVRFSSTPPNFTISFKEKGGNVLHRRVLRQVDGSVKFENGDMCERASRSFKSIPHLVEEMRVIMKWVPLPGGPFWWIFNENDNSRMTQGGYGGYSGYSSKVNFDDGADDEESSEEEDVPQLPSTTKLQKANLKPLVKIRFLSRSGVITEVRGHKIQVLFSDNGRKEWVKEEGLLQRGFLEH